MVKILIADDDTEIQELLNFTLENEGYQVITADNGEEAVHKAIKEKPDLIILDVMMPKMTGYEACEAIRENPSTSLIPIILLTSLSQTKDRITGIKLGADQYLTKPFEPIELTARVESLLKRVKAEVSANPLTALNGNNTVEIEIKKRLEENTGFNVFYMDINSFKPFNDKYGFETGDQVLRAFAGMLEKTMENSPDSRCLLGHIVSDNFVILCSMEKPEGMAKKLIEMFTAFSIEQYDPNTREKGYITARNSEGKEINAPLMTLAIGILEVKPGTYKHHIQVIEKAKELWKKAKQKPGPNYEIN